jgi:hypothetical protein
VSITAKQSRRVLVVLAFLAYGWWLTARKPFSDSALIALLIVIGALIAVAEVHRHRGADTLRDAATRRAPLYRRAVVVWTTLTAALIAWELIALRASPRSQRLTISSLVEHAEHHHVARLALYAVWLWVGWELAS